jgi:hypothetical protein
MIGGFHYGKYNPQSWKWQRWLAYLNIEKLEEFENVIKFKMVITINTLIEAGMK